MIPAARLQATIDILESIAVQPRPADALVGAYFRARRYMGSHDRNAVATRLYAVLRHQARLDWWLERLSKIPTPASGARKWSTGPFTAHAPHPRGAGESLPRLRTLIWLALGEQIPANVIDELCSGGKFAPAVLSDVERGFLKKSAGNTPLAVQEGAPTLELRELKSRTSRYAGRDRCRMSAGYGRCLAQKIRQLFHARNARDAGTGPARSARQYYQGHA